VLRNFSFRSGLLCLAVCLLGCHTTTVVPPEEIGHHPELCIRGLTTRQGDTVEFSADPRSPCAAIEDGSIAGRLQDGTHYEVPLSDVAEVRVLYRKTLRRERTIGLGFSYLLFVATVGTAVALWYAVSRGGIS
jgi:hypothetical protein